MQKVIYNTVKLLAFLVSRFLFRIEVKGEKNIEKGKPCIIIANHASFLDAIALGSSLPIQVNYFAKSTLFKLPVLSKLLPCLGALPLDRSAPASLTLRTGYRALKKNKALVVFPEGTRSKTGKFLPPKPGIGLLHSKSGAPIIPVLIQGTARAMPVGARFIRPGTKITIRFGPKFKAESKNYEEIALLAMHKIEQLGSL